MDVAQINSTAQVNQTGQRQVKTELGKDEFLKILVAQLQNQNPLNPMNDESFIGQMAQFSALEQMKTLNTNSVLSQAFSLIGKRVYAEQDVEGRVEILPVYGIVSKVTAAGDKISLNVGGIDVSMDEIKEVYNGLSQTESTV